MSLETVHKELLWNFDTLIHVTEQTTLLVVGNRLELDTRSLQSIRRTYTADSRFQIIDKIKRTLVVCEELLVSYKLSSFLNHCQTKDDYLLASVVKRNVDQLASRLPSAGEGLGKLANFERYSHDKHFQIEIGYLKDKLQTLSDLCCSITVMYAKLTVE